MKKRVKITAFAVLAACLLIGGIWYLLRPLEVETEQVLRADLREEFLASGTVTPSRSAYVCAALPGTVERLILEEGRTAEQGQEILVLNDAEAREDLENQIASLELQKKGVQKQGAAANAELVISRQQIEAQLAQARLEYDQLYGASGQGQDLLNIARENFSTANIAYWRAYDEYENSQDPSENAQLSSLDAARTAARQMLIEAENSQSEGARAYLESRIASYESQLQLLDGSRSAVAAGTDASAGQVDLQIASIQNELEKGKPSAPFTGVLWELLVAEGDQVAAGQPLYRIYEPEGMKVEANLLDSQAALLKEGDEARIELADGTVLEAAVEFISPISTEEMSALGILENRCLAVLTVGELPAGIGAGHQADAAFSVIRREQVLQIPMSAVMPSESGRGVYVAENGKAVFREVELGAQSGGRAEVLSGLEEGETVIVNPYDTQVKSGKSVK